MVASSAGANKRASARQRLQQPRRIARHQVNFEINARPDPERSERGDLQRVGDDQHGKSVALDLVYGQRDAVECDRSFGRNETGKLAGRAQPQLGHVDEIVARYQFGDAIDMAAHHMAAELVAEAERAFEIEPGAARPGAGGGHPQGLGRGVHRKGGSVTGPPTAHDRQADA